MAKSNNIYDWFLTLLLFLLIFGNVGNGAQPIRLLIMAISPIMICDAIRRTHKSITYYKYECFFLLGWWLWAISFFYKAEIPAESAKHVIYLLTHMLGFLEVLWAASKANNPQRSVRDGWLLMLAVSIPIAINEFLTDDHMATSLWDSGATLDIKGVKIERPFAAVTFGNLNTYNTVLCWTMPSLFFCNLFPMRKFDKIIGLVLMFISMALVVANASRSAIMCMSSMLILFIICYYRTGRNRIFLISIIVVITCVFCYYLLDLFFLILNRFDTQGLEDTGRSENIVKGIQAFIDSGLLGIGIGNYEPIMDKVYNVGIPLPHNLYLEILVVYGGLIFVGFIGMLCRIFSIGRKGEKCNHNMLLFCMASLFFSSIIDSQYVMKMPTWMFLATAYIYVDKRYNYLNFSTNASIKSA